MKELTKLVSKLVWSKWQIGIYIVIFIIISGGVSYVLYSNNIKESKIVALELLKETLNEELDKRCGKEMYSSCGELGSGSLTIDSFLKNIKIETAEGVKKYVVEYEQHIHNIIDNINYRIGHSIVLSEYPLVIDSINDSWQEKMDEKYSARAALQIVYSTGLDSLSMNKELKSVNFSLVKFSDALPPLYIGYACEYKVIGFISFPFWFSTRYFILFFLSVCVIIASCGLIYLLKLHTFFKSKYLPVSVIFKELPDCIAIKEYLFFIPSKKTLFAGEKEIILNGNKSTLFLEAILKSPNYILVDELALSICWPDGSGNVARLQTLVSRLRTELVRVAPDVRLERRDYSYQLSF